MPCAWACPINWFRTRLQVGCSQNESSQVYSSLERESIVEREETSTLPPPVLSLVSRRAIACRLLRRNSACHRIILTAGKASRFRLQLQSAKKGGSSAASSGHAAHHKQATFRDKHASTPNTHTHPPLSPFHSRCAARVALPVMPFHSSRLSPQFNPAQKKKEQYSRQRLCPCDVVRDEGTQDVFLVQFAAYSK